MKRSTWRSFLAMALAIQMAASGSALTFAQAVQMEVRPSAAISEEAEEEGVYISDLQWASATTAWGQPQKDQGLDNKPLRFRDGAGGHIFYEKGICIHAPSKLVYDIEGMGAEEFTSWVGIHDGENNDKKEKSSCEFVVEIDGEEVYRSDVRRMDSGPLQISVAIPEGAKTLSLITTDGGDGDKQGDHSTWADAKLLLNEAVLKSLKSVSVRAEKNMLDVGENVPLTVAGTLVDGTAVAFEEGDLVFSSSDSAVASVSDAGVVTALANGIAEITCEATLGEVTKTASVEIVVGQEVEGRVWSLQSPDQSVQTILRLSESGALSYTVLREDKTVLDWAALGMETNLANFSEGLEYAGVSDVVKIDETYTVPSHKKAEYVNRAEERTVSFTKDGARFDVIVRAYDDGIAVRYGISGDADALSITGENTAFQVPAGSTAWAMPYTGSGFSYEASFSEVAIEKLNGNQSIPLLVKTPDDVYALLTEADLSGAYSGSMVKTDGTGLLQITPSVEQGSRPIETGAPFLSPWRTAIIGTLSDIVENTMVENLSPDPDPEVQDDYSWVKPGVSSWTWLVGGFNMQSDTTAIKEYIDFAAEMGWEYFIMDRGWQPEAPNPDHQRYAYEGYFDWYDEIQAYADEKGVGLIAWVICDDLNTPEKRAARLPDWAAKGIKGIKVDFFDSEAQSRMQLYDDIYKDCAKYGLVVNAHGANKPTGEVRTYPHVLTREAVRGEEHSLTPFQYSVIPFTRAAVGPADVTEQIYPRGSNPTTTGFQAALSVLVQSGMHCLASSIADYRSSPAYSLYQNMPVVWDDTKLLDGEVGDFTTMVRRSGEDWYGACVSVDARNAEFPLDFLGDGSYYALIYRDGPGDKRSMAFEAKEVTSADTLSIPVKAGGGCAVKILKEKPSSITSVVLDQTEMTLQQGQSATITATFQPEDALLRDLVWSSSDETVAVVSAGKVTALQPGTAIITVASALNPDVKAECVVTVKAKPYLVNDAVWGVRRENPGALQYNSENSITVTSQYGDVSQTTGDRTIKNMMLTVPADEDFTATVKVTGDFNASFQTGALAAMTDETHLIATMRRFHEKFGGNCFDFMKYENGYKELTAPDTQNGKQAWLKLTKKGTTFTSSYSYDNQTWVSLGEQVCTSVGNAGKENIKLGVMAFNGGREISTDVTFEDFTYYPGDSAEGTVLPFAVVNPAAQPSELSVNYGKNVTLKVNGEEQKLADLIGRYTQKDVDSGTKLQLAFAPRLENELFRSVSVNGAEPTVISGKEYLYDFTMGMDAANLQFVFETVNKTTLDQVVAYAKARIDAGEIKGLIPVVQEKFMAAYDAAVAVQKDAAATQSEINTAWKDLMNMLHYLEFKPGDKKDLDHWITVAENMNADLFTEASWAVVANALVEAKGVMADENALQGDITKARDTLYDAIMALVDKVDRTELDAFIAEGTRIEGILDTDYLPVGQEAFKAALKVARELPVDADQAAVNAAALRLVEAMSGLRLIPTREVLKEQIDAAESIDRSLYTASSLMTLDEKIAAAKDAYENAETQEEITKAFDELVDAQEKLTKRQENGKTSSGSSTRVADNSYGSAGTAVAGAQNTAAYVRSDTTMNFALKRGQAYCFKMTVFNGNGLAPNFTVGDGSVLKTQFVAQIGNDYYFRVWAIGAPGTSAGVYTSLNGKEAVKHCTVSIA